jgi:catechol 2,3-dioxygenase
MFEIGAGGYLILEPDRPPVIWTQAERAQGQAWGLQTVSTFHTHGTPPVPGADPSSG